MTTEINSNIQKEAKQLARKVVREVKKDEKAKLGAPAELSLSETRLEDGTVLLQAGGGVKIAPCDGCE